MGASHLSAGMGNDSHGCPWERLHTAEALKGLGLLGSVLEPPSLLRLCARRRARGSSPTNPAPHHCSSGEKVPGVWGIWGIREHRGLLGGGSPLDEGEWVGRRIVWGAFRLLWSLEARVASVRLRPCGESHGSPQKRSIRISPDGPREGMRGWRRRDGVSGVLCNIPTVPWRCMRKNLGCAQSH